MKICKGLIQNINVEPNKIMPCCRIAVHNMPYTPIIQSKNIDSYITMLSSCLDGYNYFCMGCPEKGTYEVQEYDIRDLLDISLIWINHHRNYCDCKCTYCDFWKTPVHPFSIRPLLKELLSSGFVNPKACISWGGGESTILPEFEETATNLLEKGFEQQVLTNALRPSRAVQKILKEGKGRVIVSLDCGTGDTYRAIKGVNGFKRVVDTLKAYADAAHNVQDITIKYIIFDQNNAHEEIDKFFAVCSEIGNVTLASAFEMMETENMNVSEASKKALVYFRQKIKEKTHSYADWANEAFPCSEIALIPDDNPVYYYGGGDYYQRHKHLYSRCSPRCILLDNKPENLVAIDGIPVRHPSEVLPQGERLPIVIFAWDPIPILRTIDTHYPWYTSVGNRICLPTGTRRQ